MAEMSFLLVGALGNDLESSRDRQVSCVTVAVAQNPHAAGPARLSSEPGQDKKHGPFQPHADDVDVWRQPTTHLGSSKHVTINT